MGEDLEIDCGRGFREKSDLSETEGNKDEERFKNLVSISASITQRRVYQGNNERNQPPD